MLSELRGRLAIKDTLTTLPVTSGVLSLKWTTKRGVPVCVFVCVHVYVYVLGNFLMI